MSKILQSINLRLKGIFDRNVRFQIFPESSQLKTLFVHLQVTGAFRVLNRCQAIKDFKPRKENPLKSVVFPPS